MGAFAVPDEFQGWIGAPPDGYPYNYTSAGVEASAIVATGRLRLFGVLGYNSNTVAQFVLFFDGTTLPADGAVPLFALKAAGASNFSAFWGSVGRWFNRGIVVCNSSTFATKTIGAGDCWFDVQYGL